MRKLFILLSCILLCACSAKVEEKKDEDLFDGSENPNIQYQFHQEIKDYDYVNPIQMENGKVKTVYEYINKGDSEIELGLVVFVDGIIQNVSFGDSDPTTVYKIKIAAKEKADIPVEFIPNVNKDKGIVTINFASILNPNKVKSLKAYGNNHKVSAPETSLLNLENVTVNDRKTNAEYKTIKMEKSEIENYMKTDDVTGEQNNYLDHSVIIELWQGDQEMDNTLQSGKDYQIKIAGAPGDYTLVMFKNASSSDINGYKGIDITLSKDTYAIVDGKDLNTAGDNIFFIIVPRSKDQYIVQSERFFVEE